MGPGLPDLDAYGSPADRRGQRGSGRARRTATLGSRPRRGRGMVVTYANPTRNVWWLVLGAVTLGLIFPIPAIICWVRASRYKDVSIRRPPARAWFVWALVFTVLSIGVYTAYVVAGATSGDNSDSDRYLPPKLVNVSLGTKVTMDAEVAPGSGGDTVPVALTVGKVARRSVSGATPNKEVNVTAAFQVCATSKAVDPLLTAVGIHLVTTDDADLELVDSWPLPKGFYAGQLAPHSCLTGTLGYHLPVGASPAELTFDSDVQDTVTWKIPSR